MRAHGLSEHYDLAIAGSGFAGSLMAMIARRLGMTVVLLEKAHHPRVVIGESSTPLSNLLLETLAKRYDLPRLEPLTKWGSWQQNYPHLPCGLKRGFSFFHHKLGGEPANSVDPLDRQLLVAASPHDGIADTHWFRADFDQFVMEQACAMGVAYVDGCDLQSAHRRADSWRLQCRASDQNFETTATFLVDATGPRGLLHRLMGLEDACLPGFPATAALFSHFTDVSGFSGAQHYDEGGPPYPPDAAALHHVFDGGWIWVLHFNNGWTSAGVAAEQAVADRFGFSEGQAAWTRLLNELPEVKEQFAAARQQMPFTYSPQISFRSACMAGEGWAMLPSAAGFIDPLLSTGFPLTLLGVLRLGEIFERDWKTSRLGNSLAQYARETDQELLATADLIGALYANMNDFAMFRTLSLLYFAAASYAETVRRLNKPELARSFLLHCDPVFGAGLRRLTARARQRLTAQEKLVVREQILALIAKFDVAGLTRLPSDHCYPVRAEDLFSGADKVGASRAELEEMLRSAGFQPDELTTCETFAR